MKVYSGRGLGDFYLELIRDITEHGRKVNVRGQDCLEIPEPVTLVYKSPGHCFMRIPGRRWNPFFALAEAVWILAGSGNVEWISFFNSNMRKFQDFDYPDFHGAYGLRMRYWHARKLTSSVFHSIDQIQTVISKLSGQPTTRQAVISLWDPERDNIEVSKDYPCNNWVGYTLRDNVLDQTVVIRSNDVVWGTPYNAVQFSHLQAYVAGCLGAKIGTLTYVINNLHYYLDNYKPILTKLIEKAFVPNPSLYAECVEEFSPFTRDQFDELDFDITRTLKAWKSLEDGDIKNVSFPNIKVLDHPYLNIIGNVIWLFCMVKYCENQGDSYQAHSVATQILELKQPLQDLVIDFYEGSSNPLAMLALDQVRRKKNAVSVG